MTGCHRVPEDIEPKINYAVQDRYLTQLPSPFTPLSDSEKKEDWGKEVLIGQAFAHKLDLYQAITAFKRALILIPSQNKARKMEVEYDIFLCYYLGKKYSDAIEVFETSDLKFADSSFPARHDLLVLLYESYIQTEQYPKAQRILDFISQTDEQTAEKLSTSALLLKGNIPHIQAYSQTHPEQEDIKQLLIDYNNEKKSVSKAQWLNAIVPGAGYYYLGQPQSGTTALLLNGLFIAATTYFFEKGNIAAGVIFAGFEAGWYFGGIYGAGLEAKFYNERVYERLATPFMNEKKLFPVLMLQYAF